MKEKLVKGALYLIFAQIAFLLSGYVLHFIAGRMLGPSSYGVFGVVIYLITLIQNMLRQGIPQAASKYISEDSNNSHRITRTSLRAQSVLAIGLFILFFSLSDKVALLFNDVNLANYLRASSFILLATPFFSLYLGFLNGLQLYSKQAASMAIYSSVKVTSAIILIVLGLNAYGAIFGYIVGTLSALLFAYLSFNRAKVDLKVSEGDNKFSLLRILDFAWPVTMVSFLFTALLSSDVFFVKRLIGDNALVGYYIAASTLSRIPVFLLAGLNLALFPAISKSTYLGETDRTSKYINYAIKYLSILLVPAVIVVSTEAEKIVSILYSKRFIGASQPLSILIFGTALLTIYQLLSTFISASGKPKISMLLTTLTLFSEVAAIAYLVPLFGLKGAATGLLIGSLVGITATLIYFLRVPSFRISPKLLLSTLIFVLIVYPIAYFLQFDGFPLVVVLAKFAAIFILFSAIQWLIGELDAKDLKIALDLWHFGIFNKK